MAPGAAWRGDGPEDDIWASHGCSEAWRDDPQGSMLLVCGQNSIFALHCRVYRSFFGVLSAGET